VYYDQSGRLLRIDTPLGADKALLIELQGEDAISRPFIFRIDFATGEPEMRVRGLLGKAVTLWIGAVGEAGARPVHGHVRRLTRRHASRLDTHLWHAEVVPCLWFLTQKADCRIFQAMTAPEVIARICQIHGLTFVEQRGLSGSYPRMDYCVQYRESAFDFISRLMEEFGLFYWHEHKAGQHMLVIADGNHVAPKLDPETITYGGEALGEKLAWFEQELAFRTGNWAMRDYNFETPSANLGASKPTHLDVPRMKDHEIFDYPGRYTNAGEGGTVATLRIEQEEARQRILRGGGITKGLNAGLRLTVDDQQGVGREPCLVTALRHQARDTSFWASAEDAEGSRYDNEFEALPVATPYRPARITPRPQVRGTQTAVVTGPAGSEIHTDQYGRVKLRFHWDRNPDGNADENSSCWVRVSQGWAGAGWGAMQVPRIGQEVIVDFLEGDPDRPLVVGRVYNAERMPPYRLPDNKTRMVMRSNTHKGVGFNEITFEDEAGWENVFHHAQKDQAVRVLNNRTERIDAHAVTSVGQNRTVEVGGNQKHEVGGSLNLTVGGTGALAMGLLAQVAGLAGHTAGLVSQAGAVAGGGGAPLAAFAGTIAASALGYLDGGGLASRQGVVAGPNPRADAGTALAEAGRGVGEAAGSVFPLPGIMNMVAGTFRSDTVGIAAAEQVGLAKVVNIGATALESVGKYKKIAVGEEFVIEVGDSKLIMKANGEIILLGKKFNFVASDHFQMRGAPIDMN
jgi:type VI secretion system secreted protein VgrG